MSVRFRSINATPPGGCYEYESGGVQVSSRSRFEMARKVVDLRRSQGLEITGDPMQYVYEYMCPRLPDGFCTKPSSVKFVSAEDVKKRTSELFSIPCVTVDVIQSRLATCVTCPAHTTRGFCMGCSGLIDWVYRGFSGRRAKLPPDPATGVCTVSLELTAASASVDRPPSDAGVFPEGCWRNAAREI